MAVLIDNVWFFCLIAFAAGSWIGWTFLKPE